MAKIWDDRLKRLFMINPQDFLNWLLPGAQFIEMVPLELKTLTSTVNADALCQINVNGHKALMHLEFQKNADYNMDRRVWDYNVRATLIHQCPVYSFVIYLLTSGKVPESPLIWGLPGYRQVHIFEFTNIKLRDLSVDLFRTLGLKSLLPLCLLTRDGARQEVGEEVLASVQDNHELVNLAIGLASLVLTSESDKQWLERKIAMLEEILQDTWYYKWIHDRGLTEALEEERRAVLEAIRARFPDLREMVQQRVEQTNDPVTLRNLIVRVVAARDREEAMRALHEMDGGL